MVALVVTIVVLLILAGIAITYVMGDNSIFKQTQNANVYTKLSKIEEQAGIIYSSLLIQKQRGEINNISNKDIVDKLIENGNQIEIRSIDGHEITGISLEPTTVKMEKNEKTTVKIKGVEDDKIYYAVIEGKYYKMKFTNFSLSIDREASSLEGNIVEEARIVVLEEYDTNIISDLKINQNEKTIEITSGTTYGNTIMTVKYGEITETLNVIVEEMESDWEEISKIAKEIADDNSITNNSTTAQVVVDGISKTINVGEIYKIKYDGEIKRVRVLGFKHDDLVDTGAYGGNHTKAGISFEFYDYMMGTKGLQMNSTSVSNIWATTEMRKKLNGYSNGNNVQNETIGGEAAKLSNKSYIKQVTKQYIGKYNDVSTNNNFSQDYLWLLSCGEIWSDGYFDGGTGYSITKEGLQYKLYKSVETGWKLENKNLEKNIKISSQGNIWWLRSVCGTNGGNFCAVTPGGLCNHYTAKNTYGVAPGFCI